MVTTINFISEQSAKDPVAPFASEVRSARESIDAERRLPASLVRSLSTVGLFRLLAPDTVGGGEMDPLSAARVVEAMSTIDSTVGWSIMIASQWSWFTGFLPHSVTQEVLGDPNATLAGRMGAIGEGITIDGGHRVSGVWPYASGSDHASWFVAATKIKDGGTRLMFVPRSEIELIDVWNVSGLRGTASNELVLRDVAVPIERSVAWPPVEPSVVTSPLYGSYGFMMNFITQAGHAFGVARRSIDAFVDIAASTTRRRDAGNLQDEPNIRSRVAHAEAMLAASRAYAYQAADAVWQSLCDDEELSASKRAHLRLAYTHGIDSAVRIVDSMFTSAGSRALPMSSPLDQCFRDMHAAAAHVQATPKHYEDTGRVFLGLEPPDGVGW